jgi:hypothetical protein
MGWDGIRWDGMECMNECTINTRTLSFVRVMFIFSTLVRKKATRRRRTHPSIREPKEAEWMGWVALN